jgi:hypothetical protein
MPIPNKKKTGGPKSPEARSLVSANALKTGAYAMQVVLPGEDAEQFEQLQRQLMEDFDPVGLAESAMVHDLAVLSWKKLRIDRVENAVMAQLLLMPMTVDRIQKSYGFGFEPAAMSRLVPYRPVTQKEYDSTIKLANQVDALVEIPIEKRKHVSLRKKWPEVYELIDENAEEYGFVLDDASDNPLRANQEQTLDIYLVELSRACQPICWMWENRERVHIAIRRAQDSRLLEYMKVQNTQRAQEDTSRAFYRTLAELRKQRDWRIRRAVVNVDDVTPIPSAADSVGKA